jgi:hypothetical protein
MSTDSPPQADGDGRSSEDSLRETLRFWTLGLGVIQVLFGCVVGLVPAALVPWFRGIVMAHLAFTANGVLMIVLGLLLREMRLGRRALLIWFVALQIGTWMNGAGGLLAALLGAGSNLTPTANLQSPPPHGAGSVLVSSALVICGVGILVALGLSIHGLLQAWRTRPSKRVSG